jgi:Holliday junction resolvase RusA-like endonuclease
MAKVNIKPLSVNECWQGRRFKTEKYKSYELECIYLLPNNIDITNKLNIEFGMSSKLSDIDNPLKPFLDILQKKYGINDRNITELTVKKTVVTKGNEYIFFFFY